MVVELVTVFIVIHDLIGEARIMVQLNGEVG